MNNGTMTSRAAEVRIEVNPNPNDKQPPTILWTSPASGEETSASSTTFISGTAQLYAPVIQIQFSEVMKAETLLPANFQLLGANDEPVEITLRYDSALDQAVLLMTNPPQVNTEYTVVVTTGVTDLVGNSLAQEVRSSFRINAGQADGEIFLPTIQR